MGLKMVVKSLDDVPEASRGLYKKDEESDEFVLDVDDSELKGKVEEFRKNNRTLNAEVKRLKEEAERYKGIDPAKHRKAVAALEKLESEEERQLIEDGKIDEVVNRRTAAMREQFERDGKKTANELEAARKERENYKARYARLTVGQQMTEIISAAGTPKTGAATDIMSRVFSVWGLDDTGKLVAKESDGEPMYGEDGKPITPEAWATKLVNDAPHLFEPSQGGGGGGGKKSTGKSNGVRVVENDPESIALNAGDIATGKAVVRS